ncbi:helix-turn-helix domain-containing protein [Lysobacter sp. H21R4]|uniref:helix-turn-helix domain-containing protein n=1 Tax=Lysobacter sp. H21R4 TaxID=2781021 RepID=UPI001888E8C6|nr:helix-turn-helix domain-containing protein [Lysobacter sp. H21R4]QOY63238.1 helix-turn-helix domain-containing protein [Lysobacter sp. H21R4]
MSQEIALENLLWADRGQQLQVESSDNESQVRRMGVSRLGSLQLPATVFTVWVQVRGSSWVEAREGRFRLRRGDWIAFERDSRPAIQSDRHGVCIGLGLGSEMMHAAADMAEPGLYPGRGHLRLHEMRMFLALWRSATRRLSGSPALDAAATVGILRPLLLKLASMQSEMSASIPLCPGRSRRRKRQVFGRLQRAHMYLYGNRDRVVRISELAELTSFSSWYFSKTFHGLYGESPQSASARMRLEQAAEMLRDSQMMVGEVAAASGFDNCCSFARAFRARYQTSATNYRKAAALTGRTGSAKS